MNEDHADACRLYATRLLGAPDGEWRCAGLDPEGLELQNGRVALRLPFPQRVNGPGPLRAVLVKMAAGGAGIDRIAAKCLLETRPDAVDLNRINGRSDEVVIQTPFRIRRRGCDMDIRLSHRPVEGKNP